MNAPIWQTLFIALVVSTTTFAQTPVSDELIAKIFGAESREAKQPLRLALPRIALVATFEEFKILGDGRVELLGPLSVSVKREEAFDIHRADRAVLTVNSPVKRLIDLPATQVSLIELHRKQSVTKLTAIPLLPRTGLTNAELSGPMPGPKKDPPPIPLDLRFHFRFDAKTPLSDLLPRASKHAKLPTPFNEDLTKVAELALEEPFAKTMAKMEAMEQIAQRLARANHLNRPKTDGFMEALIAHRSDLTGLSFRMGEECRTPEEEAKFFEMLVHPINALLQSSRGKPLGEEAAERLWTQLGQSLAAINAGTAYDKVNLSRANRALFHRALVGVLTQVMMPESESHRVGLARTLGAIQHVEATRALARLVLFAPEQDVRDAAIDGLKLRRDQDYTQILLDGFRYPLPAVAKRAAEALVKLERKDLVGQLVDVLERADPRLPVTEKGVTTVREVVKVNHHRNCLLCHAPGNTDNVPDGVLKVAVPLPAEPLSKPSDSGGYQSAPTPDILVRIDMTYLRQDFALMLPVADAHPWPDRQRFDFLVRRRVVSASEASAYVEPREPGWLSPYHRAALYALRELTGRDTEPSAAGWRRLLKLPSKS